MEENSNKKHTVNMIERERLILAGVKEVFYFDEQFIELETTKGYLHIRGINLHIIKMNVDEGDIAIEGQIDELVYHDKAGGKKKGTVMSKLFK